MTDKMPRTVEVTDEEIIQMLSEFEDPIRTAPGMAEEVKIGPDGLRNRLKSLEEEGVVKSKEVGARSVVWWLDS